MTCAYDATSRSPSWAMCSSSMAISPVLALSSGPRMRAGRPRTNDHVPATLSPTLHHFHDPVVASHGALAANNALNPVPQIAVYLSGVAVKHPPLEHEVCVFRATDVADDRVVTSAFHAGMVRGAISGIEPAAPGEQLPPGQPGRHVEQHDKRLQRRDNERASSATLRSDPVPYADRAAARRAAARLARPRENPERVRQARYRRSARTPVRLPKPPRGEFPLVGAAKENKGPAPRLTPGRRSPRAKRRRLPVRHRRMSMSHRKNRRE